MRVLVTRPLDDAMETAAQLVARGHQTFLAPLLEIRICAGTELSLVGVQAILATSSNGVRAFSQRSVRRDLPLFAVGEQTAYIARQLGFSDAKSADGDVHALVAAVSTWTRPECGILLHAAGAREPGALAIDLRAKGYDIRTEMLYRAAPARQLPDKSRNALRAGMVDAVLLFSPQTARTFVDCVTEAGLESHCRRIVACCISQAAAAPLAALDFRDIRWPAHPDQASLLALLY